MTEGRKPKRFIFKTNGVCPTEIHFQVQKDIIDDILFVGGGCPGNAQLVGRLLRGRPIEEVLKLIDGIQCRNGTSCPDQLATAIMSAMDGRLAPADSFRLFSDPSPRNRVGLIGELAGDQNALKRIVDSMTAAGVEAVYCLGNLIGNSTQDDTKRLIKLFRDLKFVCIQGENDWKIDVHKEDPMVHDWLIQLPQVSTFQLGTKNCIAFFGDYILKLPGFSDFEPFALEMNMVCGLTDFMQDDTVFPALEAMIPQFQGDIVIFSQIKQWGHWKVGGKGFISVGSAANPDGLSWGLLESAHDDARFEVIRVN
jgi:uncharacterized protein (TIGR03905 family)